MSKPLIFQKVNIKIPPKNALCQIIIGSIFLVLLNIMHIMSGVLDFTPNMWIWYIYYRFYILYPVTVLKTATYYILRIQQYM